MDCLYREKERSSRESVFEVEEGNFWNAKRQKCKKIQRKGFSSGSESCLFDAKREFEDKKCLQIFRHIAFIPMFLFLSFIPHNAAITQIQQKHRV